MPNLLKSNASLNTVRPPKSSQESWAQECRRSADGEHDLSPLRRQVSAIIDAILADTTPEEAPVREKLRWHVANNPGQPEKALLSHLLAVSAEQQAS
ncbi:hypothetical protein [Arthrobacter sp. PsM3]|uniref:hypothetical protein n=1 Tax=Arthrobacter sp. PsM3 TaxID=3030531 RepID=UPI00263A4D4D|nr:hypothetical protein [Arthrobacter sp. PsM3]MDN4642402.1 hypothetical protein [Arthrobacter sp. PsM3]